MAEGYSGTFDSTSRSLTILPGHHLYRTQTSRHEDFTEPNELRAWKQHLQRSDMRRLGMPQVQPSSRCSER